MKSTKAMIIAVLTVTSFAANANVLRQAAQDSALCEGVFNGLTEKRGDFYERAATKLMQVNFDYQVKHQAITRKERDALMEKGIDIGMDIAEGKGPKGLLASCRALVK